MREQPPGGAAAPPASAKRVLVLVGHPRPGSFCAALADAYVEGARAAGAEVERIDLSALAFDADVHPPSPRDQPLEPDLVHAKAALERAAHLAVFWPSWWGVGPARLKGFLDRVLLPGFAFRERADGRFEGLLGGRTAHLVTTLDMPAWVYRWIYRAPGVNALRRSSLGFCGIETTRVALLGPVKDAEAVERAGWLQRARALGLSLRHGPRSAAGRARRGMLAWLAALRLQFHPMAWMAYSVGALLAAGGRPLDAASYLVGGAFLFSLEAATVLANDWFDRDSDRRNVNAGVFTGGSRMLVDGRIAPTAWWRGTALALLAALACAGWLIDRHAGSVAVPAALGLLGVLAVGYTAPPLRLCWRGWGEADVALTHSAGVLLTGFLLQGGSVHDPLPWLASLPIGLAVWPAIALSGIPDADADRAAGKRTLAVRWGVRRTAGAALAAVPLAPLAVIAAGASGTAAGAAVGGLYGGVLPFALPHAALLMALLGRRLRTGLGCERIDGVMVAALAYIVWFALGPLMRLS